MIRRVALIVALAQLVMFLPAVRAASVPKKPNVIIILTDDQATRI